MSGDGLVTYAAVAGEKNFADLYKWWEGRAKIDIEFTVWDCSGGAPNVGDTVYSGKCYITSLSQTGGVEDNATYSFTIEGTGVLTDTVIA
jgi:hypothetical protein